MVESGGVLIVTANDRERRRHMSHLWTRHSIVRPLELGCDYSSKVRGDKGLEVSRDREEKFPPLFWTTSPCPSQPVLAIRLTSLTISASELCLESSKISSRLLFLWAETHQQDQLFSHAWIEITEIPSRQGVYALEGSMKGKRVSA